MKNTRLGATIKVLLIITVVFMAISFGALVGGLSQLIKKQDNYWIFLVVFGSTAFVAIILIVIIVTTYFKEKKKLGF